MVGEVVGLRRSNKGHNSTIQHRTVQHRTKQYKKLFNFKPSPLPIKAEHNSLRKQSKNNKRQINCFIGGNSHRENYSLLKVINGQESQG